MSHKLKRGLKNRHIQLIALGGTIGTGLFLGVGSALEISGPSIIVTYFIGGIISLLIMRQLAEMTVHEPVSGTFSHFAYKYWGDFPGFFSGWNYWVLYVLVGMAELTSLNKYMVYWFPDAPAWLTVMIFFVLILLLN